jgi:hypothetical protein
VPNEYEILIKSPSIEEPDEIKFDDDEISEYL